MADWADVAAARRHWADAPRDVLLLEELLTAAQEQCEEYAPRLVVGAPVPARYTQAVVAQARENWSAMERDGDVLGFAGDYAVRVRPLTAGVKSLLRPKRAQPAGWPLPGEE